MLVIRKTPGLNTQPRSLSYNPAENAVLLIGVCFCNFIAILVIHQLEQGVEGANYELYQLPKQASSTIVDVRDASGDCKSGLATSAIFVARNRYVTLNKSQQV
jgi:coatomer protein complex subunit alpha (xenin)